MAIYTVMGWLDHQARVTVDYCDAEPLRAVHLVRRNQKSRHPDWRFLLCFAGKQRLVAPAEAMLDAQAPSRAPRPPRRSGPYTVCGFWSETMESFTLLNEAGDGPEALTLAEARTGGAAVGAVLAAVFGNHLTPVLTSENMPLDF